MERGEEGGGGGGGGYQNYNAVFVAMEQSCTRRPRKLFLPVNKVEKGEEEERRRRRRRRRRRKRKRKKRRGVGEGGRRGRGGDYNCNAVFRSNAVEFYSAKAFVSFQ